MMKMKVRFLALFLFLQMFGKVKSQVIFTSVDSLFGYATAKSISLQSGNVKLDQAKKAKLAAILSIPDVTGNLSLSYTKNTRLPVNLFPAEVFGGQAGTYKEVESGVPYVTNANENIDIKLFNPKGWENVKLYKLNVESNVADNKVTLKTLYENISASYYNIVSLQQQLLSTNENIKTATTLLEITENKYKAGLIKQQDVNDAKVNLLTAKENYNQIQYLITQQYLALKILCDIPEQEDIKVDNKIADTGNLQKPVALPNNISFTNSVLKEKIAFSGYKQQKYSLYPTVSFFQAYTTQQYNTRGKLFDNSVKWIPSSYIGLRLSIPIPSSNSVTQVSKARYDYLLSQKNTEQQKIKAALEVKQLEVDYNKAVSQAKSNNEIYLLRRETYEKNLNLYNEGLTNLEQALNSFNAMVSSNYNLIASQVTILSAKTKIDINNSIK
jgi:outer membrane protein TolC